MDATFDEAQKQFMLGQFKVAEKLFTDFVEQCNAEVTCDSSASCDKTNREKMLAQAYNNRGQIKYLRVDFDEAVEDYTAAINVDDTFAIAYYNRGQIHYRLARFQSGINDFKEALRLCPDFPDAEVALKTSQEDLERSQHVPPSQHL
ncbi:tetratricopeptide repeat protein 32-like [Asterias amurensis]|uniref:tetratricopeptide repeat protein 32-like n=1 Tax=Asterias amurensis TaxID=7602 RepID=UPI003AB406E5